MKINFAPNRTPVDRQHAHLADLEPKIGGNIDQRIHAEKTDHFLEEHIE
ncbi:MAG: hypothetical protein ACM36A_08130 [Bacteroidota bacterium]